MMLKMKRHASRGDSGIHQFKIRVPTDVRERAKGRRLTVVLPATASDPEAVLTVTLGEFCKGSLRTRDARTADVRIHVVRAALLSFCDRLRSGTVELSQRQIEALAGDVHRHLLAEHEDNPGTPREWESFKALCRAAVEGRITDAPPIPEHGRSDDEVIRVLLFGEAEGEALTASVDALAATWDTRALEQRVGRLAYWALQSRGIEVDSEIRVRLLRRIAVAALQAGGTLKRMAGGDYRPDPAAERFPVFEKAKAKAVTLSMLFERWAGEVDRSPATLSTWRGVMRQLKSYLGQDKEVAKLTKADVIGWKDHLVAKGLRPKTVNDQHLTALKAILNWGVANDVVRENVATGIRLKVQEQAGERMLSYDDGELARLLDYASRETRPARRWLPMLAVYTGARIGELAQLWGGQVTLRDGVPVIEIRPSKDGGRLKTASSERVVPLHRAIIEAGFLDYVSERGDAPLFYRDPAKRGSEAKHPSKGTANHLAAWVGKLPGFDDPRKSALHACRHAFKSTGARLEISDSLIDAIQGHKDKTTAGTYRHFTVAQMAAAIARYPVHSLANGEIDGAIEVAVPITDDAVENRPARTRRVTLAPQ